MSELTDEEAVLMRRIMADALTIKPGGRAVEFMFDDPTPWLPITIAGEWRKDSYSGEWVCDCQTWPDIHQEKNGYPAATLAHRILKLTEDNECPVLREFDIKFVTSCVEKVVRACWNSDFETMRQVGVHHSYDNERQQSRVLRDEEEEDEIRIDWINEPIAQDGTLPRYVTVVFE